MMVSEVDNTSRKTQFILYACPTGELGQQLETYFEKSLAQCGPNTAHQYMPHCTLTGFFEDDLQKANHYVEALKQSLSEQLLFCPNPVAEVTQMSFQNDWHGLELEAPWFQKLAKTFSTLAPSPTPLRLKTWLHVSLAYGFGSTHADALRQLALNIVNPKASVTWAIRLYQRQPDWYCHYDYSPDHYRHP